MNKADLKSAAPLAGVIAVIVVAMAVGSALVGGPHTPPQPGAPHAADDAAVARVSLIQLIAAPEKYDAKRVRVAGFLVNEGDDHALYLSVSDAANGIAENSVAVDFTAAAVTADAQNTLHRDYVVLGGTFHAQSPAHIDGVDVLEPRTGAAAPAQ